AERGQRTGDRRHPPDLDRHVAGDAAAARRGARHRRRRTSGGTAGRRRRRVGGPSGVVVIVTTTRGKEAAAAGQGRGAGGTLDEEAPARPTAPRTVGGCLRILSHVIPPRVSAVRMSATAE